MNSALLHTFVIAVALFQGAAGTEPPALTDADAYAVYGALFEGSKAESILIQQETQTWPPSGGYCVPFVSKLPGDWQEAAHDFSQKNGHRWLLQPRLPFTYRFISRAEIEADDARLRTKYPGGRNRLPEAIEYRALSAVGFNAAKTKAIVYTRARGSDGVSAFEWKYGRCVRWPESCGGVA